jgi:hypothetical protein
MSNELNELATALAKAQAEMKNPGFDSTNPHFRNKFASLAAVRNAVVPILAKFGLSVVQDLTTSDKGEILCRTVLLHSSGQSLILGPLALPATKTDAQGYGSAATYARRYSLMAVAGVVGDDDDDANAATGKPAEAERLAQVAARAKNTKAANEYAQRVVAALNDGADLSAVDIMREAKDVSEEFATDVWHCFSTPIRNRLRELSKVA